tara:strand:- start:130126 stop:130317 length:192 start_codon:yes stop_codon:yes gene_type:complete
MTSEVENICEAYNSAIEFALEERSDTAQYFLQLWMEGCWPEIKEEFPKFNLSTAVSCGYVEED